ncbi:hypothetical protein D3C85_1001290 [compost metagenome]
MGCVGYCTLITLCHSPLQGVGLYGADVFLAGTDGNLHSVDDNLFGSSCNRHQT